MILDGDYSPAALLGVFDDEFGVDGFDGKRIHHSDFDAFLLQHVGRLCKRKRIDCTMLMRPWSSINDHNDFRALTFNLLVAFVKNLESRINQHVS